MKKGPKVETESAEEVAKAHHKKDKNQGQLTGKAGSLLDVSCSELVYYVP